MSIEEKAGEGQRSAADATPPGRVPPGGPWAHSADGEREWQPLRDHLKAVAALARGFAAPFGAGDWAYLAGLWHDLGKYSAAFQAYLGRNTRADYHVEEAYEAAAPVAKVDHTTAGAQHAVAAVPVLGHLLAYAVSGHHSGLLDALSDGACLERRLKKAIQPWQHGLDQLPPASLPTLPHHLQCSLGRRGPNPRGTAFSFAFFVSMLFSCLVDADYLDTEAFMDPARAASRPEWPDNVLELMEAALEAYVSPLGEDNSNVNRARREVRQACQAAALLPPGLFSLTVPTGGGKTLSSVAFGLRHARLHRLDRIIYVIPFTSIIEQNAAVFRRVFEPLSKAGVSNPVLEHHSAVQVGRETLETRLAAEDWDAPLVVTTSVQLFESLFSNRPGRCRKLHNLARAVIVLDEAQKLPVEFLAPCLSALRELTRGYGSTVVLCTATQPAIHLRDEFPIGLDGVREIVPEPRTLYLALKRVRIESIGELPDDELAERLEAHDQVLCIVNTRRHARGLFERLNDDAGTVHLSAAMCPAHRAVALDNVRRRLRRGDRCRLISTQVVEAGVDVDFPAVYRSLAGLDSIAQAAGRCNREGRLATACTYVFRSEHERAESFLRDTANATSQILGREASDALYEDLLSLEAVEHYFRLYYWSQQQRWDHHRILDNLSLVPSSHELPFQFAFSENASKFRLIRDSGKPVIIPWGDEGEHLCRELRSSARLPERRLLRSLQRYTVQAPQRVFHDQLGGAIELVHDRYAILTSPELFYDDHLGLVLDRSEFEAGTFIT